MSKNPRESNPTGIVNNAFSDASNVGNAPSTVITLDGPSKQRTAGKKEFSCNLL